MTVNDDFVLTADNYYSKEANWRYMSVHQYLDFVGHLGVRGCESRALATLNGKYEKEKTTPMLVGSYLCSISEAQTGAKGCRRPNRMWQWNKKNVLCEKNPVSQHGERMKNCCRSTVQDSFSDCLMVRAGTIPERNDPLPGREGPGFPL